MLTTIIIIIAFSILVVFHEFGHFIIAKLLKVKVEKFALGFGPEWLGFSTKETRYSLNLIPLGGYVRMLGDEPGSEGVDSPFGYLAQKWYRRALIVVFGPITNFILAVLLFTMIFMVGVPTASTNRIGDVFKNTPAFTAGLKPGDTIVKINNKPINVWEDVYNIVHPSAGKALDLIIKRDGQEIKYRIIPEYNTEKKVWLMGISPEKEKFGLLTALYKGCNETYYWTELTLKAIWWMLTGKIAPEVSGPVGIAQMIGEAAKAGFASLVGFIAVLSINLGVFNLFPIPILDGGHIMFLIIEAIKGKPVSLKKIEMAQKVGLTLLIMIFLFATYKDIIRLLLPGPK